MKTTEQELDEYMKARTPEDHVRMQDTEAAIRWLCRRIDEMRATLMPWPRTDADRREMVTVVEAASQDAGRQHIYDDDRTYCSCCDRRIRCVEVGNAGEAIYQCLACAQKVVAALSPDCLPGKPAPTPPPGPGKVTP